MTMKTISLRPEAYERLRRAKRRPGESFSDVVLRARWPDAGITAGELLSRYDESGPFLSERDLERIDAVDAADSPPSDKWKR